ncbi:hypothetical protein [Sinorhizobium fredii]|uniref:Uncharacterized protein n=2 Tax=Rhizobium fredii TaxID=380 RepID=A0A844AHF0_RHIFR|nr:hypothetical protein [Sinorhizobium fredii]ASY70453.1 hypothetical protein SF83666_c30480 [Sinorhizobium fredii CCBAU 83666]AWI58829.1 hypothetical protein AB395_00003187 [Sinorhizobium fredii CCBAU 45436]AWM26536.1 hypothetical protein AOX55_00003298 [Sinorhizobium fredii CCBAU 25509]KSV90667.1 hypothetical protein N181_11430 [Sinorhizobium fredii USDA 205]MQW96102.1 hypothetical protein [Sinorhizobium fredii]
MRGLLLFIVLLAGIWAIDRIACEGHYSRAAWRDAQEQAKSLRYRVKYWVDDIVRL